MPRVGAARWHERRLGARRHQGVVERRAVADERERHHPPPLIVRHADPVLTRRIADSLRQRGVEFRRGMSGGGSQLRQPYLRRLSLNIDPRDCPQVEHVHFHGFYLGNYPTLEGDKIVALCQHLNELAEECHARG